VAREIFAAVASGIPKPNVFLRLPLADAADAHRALGLLSPRQTGRVMQSIETPHGHRMRVRDNGRVKP
jgi:hypothetical protein